MKLFKNEVGRPTNEILKKRKIFKISVIILAIVFVTFLTIGISNILTKKNNTNNVNAKYYVKKELNELINVNQLTDEFMEKFENDYKTLQKMDNLENVLIVMSKNGVKNNYGATYVVEAPNNTYYLQYNTEEERKSALASFEKEEKNKQIYGVFENTSLIDEKNATNGNNENNGLITQMASYNGEWYLEAMGLNVAFEEIEKYYQQNLNKGVSIEKIKVSIIGPYDFTNPNINYDQIFKKAGFNRDFSEIEYVNPVEIETNFSTDLFLLKMLDRILDKDKFDIAVINDFSGNKSVGALDFSTAVGRSNFINSDINIYDHQFYNLTTKNKNLIEAAIAPTSEKNVINIASAGPNKTDSDRNGYYYPAASDLVMSISSIDQNGSSYAINGNFSDKVDFVAPGTHIYVSDGVKVNDTRLSAGLAGVAAAMLKYFDKNLNQSQVYNLFEKYSIKDEEKLPGYGDFPGWGKGLIYLGDTAIFPNQYESASTTLLNKLKDALGFLSSVDWQEISTTIINILTSLMNACESINFNKIQEIQNAKPENTVEVSGNFIIKNYKKVKDMKKMQNYACDSKSECYANAYYMRLIGKVPVMYYGHCNTGNKSGVRCVLGKKYTCNSLCPNPKVSEGNLKGAYERIVKENKPSILTIKNGEITHNVVIVGVTKKSYRNYLGEEEAIGNTSAEQIKFDSLGSFVIIDINDGKVKNINSDKILNETSGWEFVSVKY